jgi:hypothetical protein
VRREAPDGQLLFLDEHQLGETREFEIIDVAYVAALSSLTCYMDVLKASQALLLAINAQPEYWGVIVDRRDANIHVGVGYYKGQTTSEIWGDLPAPNSQAEIFLSEPAEGENLGAMPPRGVSARSAAVFNVGPAVVAALGALPE